MLRLNRLSSYGRSWYATNSTVDAPRYGLWVTDFTMVRGAAAYQYVVVITPSYWLLIGDVPLTQPFDTSLNASNSPAGTAILSHATCEYRKPKPGRSGDEVRQGSDLR